MKWSRRSGGGVGDLRGRGGGGGFGRRGGGMGMPMPIGVGGGGIGLVVLVIWLLMSVLGGGGNGLGINLPASPAAPGGAMAQAPPADDEQAQFVEFVVGNVQDTWRKIFAEAGQEYEPTTLFLFSNAVRTGCGTASSDVGPFYCPADRGVYLDLGFFRELSRRFGAPGDFAQAYVIAHEFGHHVQNLLGVSDDVRQQQQEDPASANELSVRLELQADCLAGVWGHSAYTQQILEPGDLEEGLAAAAAVGDDRIQQQAGRRVDRESWTHGSSEQRQSWFMRGYESGNPSSCDTFDGS